MSTCYHGESRSRVQNRMPELLAETGQATSSADVEQTQTAIARMARPLFWFGEVHCPIIVSSSSQQAAYMYALGADRRDASRSSLRVHICRSTCIKGNGLHAIEHVYIRYVRTVKLYPSTSHYTGTNGIIDPRQGPNKQQMNHYTGPSIFCGIIGPYDIRMQSGLTNLSRSTVMLRGCNTAWVEHYQHHAYTMTPATLSTTQELVWFGAPCTCAHLSATI
jgi:hypothetical protein